MEEGRRKVKCSKDKLYNQLCGCHSYFFAVQTDGGVANSEVGHEYVVESLFHNVSEEDGPTVQCVVETPQNLSETRKRIITAKKSQPKRCFDVFS